MGYHFPIALSNFSRGDSNNDNQYNIADAIFTLHALFVIGPRHPCDDEADSNDDGGVNIADAIFTLTRLFSMGVPPPAPFPGCGPDPTADALGCDASICP